MQLKTKAKESWGKTLEKKLKALAHQFPEIRAIYQKKASWGVEIHFVADFMDRNREDAFYREQGEILAWSPEGKLLMHLFNPNNYTNPEDYSPPDGSIIIFGKNPL